MLGIYLQRSWIVLFLCCILLLPLYIFAAPILKLLGLPDEVAELSGVVALWLTPLHLIFGFQFPLQRFLQSQLKNFVITWLSLAALLVSVLISWLFVFVWDFGLVGAVVALDISSSVLAVRMFGYLLCGGCPLTWTGFPYKPFPGFWEFIKLSAASGVMLWYRISPLIF
jgi:MATE family multidrug resistance protein